MFAILLADIKGIQMTYMKKPRFNKTNLRRGVVLPECRRQTNSRRFTHQDLNREHLETGTATDYLAKLSEILPARTLQMLHQVHVEGVTISELARGEGIDKGTMSRRILQAAQDAKPGLLAVATHKNLGGESGVVVSPRTGSVVANTKLWAAPRPEMVASFDRPPALSDVHQFVMSQRLPLFNDDSAFLVAWRDPSAQTWSLAVTRLFISVDDALVASLLNGANFIVHVRSGRTTRLCAHDPIAA